MRFDLPRFDPRAAALARLGTESSPSAVLIVASDGLIVFATREIEQQFGYTSPEMIGQPLEMLLPEAPAEGVGRGRFGRRKDGSEIAVEIGLNPVEIDVDVFVLVSVVDVTERRRLEAANGHMEGERLAFEQLVGNLSARFVNLPAEQLEGSVQEAQRRIVEALDLDRCALWLEEDGDFVYRNGWTRPEYPAAPPGRWTARSLYPWTLEQLEAGRLVYVPSVDALPDVPDRATFRRFGTKSSVVVPLSVGGRTIGAITFAAIRAERTCSPYALNQLQLVASVFANAMARRAADEQLRQALTDVSRLRDQLQTENVYLRREVQERLGSGILIGHSPAMRAVLEQVQQVAATDTTVLLLGETGSGKEMFAAHIHELSARRQRTMVRVNCAAIPATLVESELFGREKGAFTGSMARQIGRFELADHSTLFLDEIGDLPPDVQIKLLRVLENGQIERLGSPKSIHVDTRVIAATHRDLEQRIETGEFRNDLFYRLNVFPIRLPPLRNRIEDIPLLIWRFVEEFAKTFGKRIESIGKDNMTALQQYPWPGNIRELRNVVERAMIVATSNRLIIPTPATSAASARRSARLIDVEREHIRQVLQSTGWRVRGADGAAARLGLPPTTLDHRLVKLGIKRPRRQ